MRISTSLTCSLILALAGGALACSDDGGDEQGDETTGDSASGDGDGDDPTDTASGDGDGDDPATDTASGDGDGDDPATDTDSGDGDGDDPTTDTDSGDGDGDAPGELSFAGDIYPIIMANCSCHLGGAPAGLAMANVDGAYSSLVSVPSSSEPEFNRVEPGNADDSYLVRKIRGTAAVGVQMPIGGELTMMEQMMIADWVNQGAMP